MKISNCLMKIVAMVIASFSFVSCETIIYDLGVIPQSSIVQIPQEGGTYTFIGFDIAPVESTRFRPGELFKCYRYRLTIGDNIGTMEHDHDSVIHFNVPANESDATRNVTLEVSLAKEHHIIGEYWYGDKWYGSACDNADTSEEHWEEWQVVWRGVQAR